MARTFLAILLVVVSSSLAGAAEPVRLTDAQFAALLEVVATGWNENNARKAADAFSEDAIYTQPPRQQVYEGREALFRFFGGPDGRKEWMRMTWHHISFDEATQVGAGEFTFAYPGGQVHGITSIRVRGGKIANWREYWYESPLEWDAFQDVNRF